MTTREKRWGYDGKLPCAGKWVRYICIVGVGDLPWVISSRMMFLNKARLDVDPEAFRCLELWYSERVRRERSSGQVDQSFNVTFYANLEFTKRHI